MFIYNETSAGIVFQKKPWPLFDQGLHFILTFNDSFHSAIRFNSRR
jgi:hypothetical protein